MPLFRRPILTAGVTWVRSLRLRLAGDRGVTAVEYGLIVAGVGIVVLGGVFFLRTALTQSFDDSLDAAGVCAGVGCDAYDTLPDPVGGVIAPSAVNLSDYAPKTGTVGTLFTSSPTVSGGTGSITYALTTGTLPAGLTLNSASGVVSGTPTAAGSSTVTITATDSATSSDPVTVTFVIAAAPAGVNLSDYSPKTGTVSTAFSSTPTVSGGPERSRTP